MTRDPEPSARLRGRAVILLEDPERVLSELLEHMTEHAEVTLTESGAFLDSPFGSVSVSRFADRVFVEAAAESPEILALIQAFVAEHVHEFAGEDVEIEWSGEAAAEAPPAGFRLASVLRAFDVTPRMRRVVFACDDPTLYAEGAGHHIRLFPAPEETPPLNRVYTIREADAAAGTVSVDFALHEGGASPGADFARKARPGERVGLMGPGGGGGPPRAKKLLLLGDEAALPAIARILAEAPPDAEIEARLEVADAREEQHLPSAARARVVWLHRGEALPGRSGLLEAALEAHLEGGAHEGLFIWAACERAVAGRLRKRLASEPGMKRRAHVYAYWESRR
ncbi:siderophore-interacting protein [Neomegalonema sp.]|uniref:siderophore-interacting protein n=1 Tax=Neomegalonema sp. TaxID=2039713 RepID=UPI0026389DEA|nr:siderophore-interacting protein [Neomegalonema sp.]MDD2867816.1 siderophore-interacting protein [Neomegalonema sp.]